MKISELRNLLQHVLVVLQNIDYLPMRPTEEDVAELKQIADVRSDVELALKLMDAEERESN